MKKENLITLDSEGVWINKSTNTANLYNVGWVIHTHGGEIMAKRHYLIKEVFLRLPKTDYYNKKIIGYLTKIEKGEIILTSCYEVFKQLVKDIREYNIKKILAYNARYDRNSIEYTMFHHKTPFIIKAEWWDTWEMFKSSRAQQTRYKRFCDENNHKTAKGNNKTTAEVATKYLRNDNEFIEEHTALEDALIEVEIYVACRKMHKKMQRLIKE